MAAKTLVATFTATIRVLPEDQEPSSEPVTEQTIQNLIGHTGAQVVEVSDLDEFGGVS